MKKVLIIDTSIMCVWLKVPGKETCGPDNNRWTYQRVVEAIEREIAEGSILILPWATIIETGNHIAQAKGDRHEVVNKFVQYVVNALDGNVPWAAFTEQFGLMERDSLKKTLATWSSTALTGQSLGDAMIVDVVRYYEAYNAEVVILTGDEGLKAYESAPKSTRIPRRNR